MTRRRSRWAWLAVGVLALAGTLGAAAGPWLLVERRVVSPDAILVLASHEHERLPLAWQLAVDHPRAAVVLSYPATPTPDNCQQCAYRAARLVRWGLAPSRVVVMEALVWNSHDELLAAAALARDRGWRRIQVVTSPYHTRRVAALARTIMGAQVDVGVVGASAEPIRPWVWWSRRYDGRYVVYELAAMGANGWRYGLWPWAWWQVEPRAGSG